MIRKSFITLLLFFILFDSKGYDFQSADFTYTRLSGNNFEITLKLYRECTATQVFDNQVVIGIFDKANNQLTDSLIMPLIVMDTSGLSSGACEYPPQVCIFSATYKATVSIPNNVHGYYLSWIQCCRNIFTENVEVIPNITGTTYYLEMPDPAIVNSSPHFNSEPLPFICRYDGFGYSVNAVDPDGDQLVYEIGEPFDGNSSGTSSVVSAPQPGPYSPVPWSLGYSLNNVYGTSIPVSIDPVTGILKGNSNLLGTFSIVVIVHEFRNGVEIGLIRREMTCAVIFCFGITIPDIDMYVSSASGNSTSFTINESDTLCFSVIATDNDSMFTEHSGDVFGDNGITAPFATTTPDTTGAGQITTDFCWTTTCNHSRAQPYTALYSATDKTCPMGFTRFVSVSIYVNPMPFVPAPVVLCFNRIDSNQIIIALTDTFHFEKYFSSYLVSRSVNGSPFNVYDTISDPHPQQYIDSAALSNVQNTYCYFFEGVNRCGEIGTTSDTLCTSTTYQNLNYIVSVTVTSENEVQLNWEHFPLVPYSIFYIEKKENNAVSTFLPFTSLLHPAGDSVYDNSVHTNEKSYCYQMNNKDYCGNESPFSNEACTILLKGTKEPGVNYLNWTAYHYWNGNVKYYEIWRKQSAENIFNKIATCTDDSTLKYIDSDFDPAAGEFTYFIKAIEDSGSFNAISISNEITLSQDPVVYLPDAFTPNNDGRNDEWGSFASFISEYHLSVFNRWGTLVFETDNLSQSWDGNYNGKPAMEGIYVYSLHFTSTYQPRITIKHGTITLIR